MTSGQSQESSTSSDVLRTAFILDAELIDIHRGAKDMDTEQILATVRSGIGKIITRIQGDRLIKVLRESK